MEEETVNLEDDKKKKEEKDEFTVITPIYNCFKIDFLTFSLAIYGGKSEKDTICNKLFG